MAENLKNFLKMVSEDKALAEKFSRLDKADMIAAAKELGVELTEADFAQPNGVVSDEIWYDRMIWGSAQEKPQSEKTKVEASDSVDASTFCFGYCSGQAGSSEIQ